MKTTGIALLSAAALLGPAAANAAESLPWTFGELAYIRGDGFEFAELDGYQLRGSVGFLEKWHAQLDYTDGEIDTDFTSVDDPNPDFDGFRLVVGGHHQLGESTQLLTDLTYFDYDYDGFDTDGGEGVSGYGAGFGLRHAFTSKVEATAEVWYVEGEIDPDGGGSSFDYNDTLIELSGRYNWTPQLSTGLTVFLNGSFVGGSSFGSSGGDLARFDVRWSFGNNGFSDLK